MKHYFIYYKIDSEDSEDIEEFFKYITQPPAVNAYIEATYGSQPITANLPDGCLVSWFPDEFTPQMVYQYFQDAVSTLKVDYQDLVCVDMTHKNSIFLGPIAP